MNSSTSKKRLQMAVTVELTKSADGAQSTGNLTAEVFKK